ncbi:hypothetical protein J7438_24500 [Thalassotalea sp. G20_0]|uniref:hypothetical protein n=1 Tax=Thalassotalea sp. G20_0 TaxID=2821093 RepID=UPI001ADB237E|nr:hypothetical protein [Thalassotalea sp. G20_0]MBO9497220.1 hypothetical protein [Thalassotalea sp. G20_0]
MDVHIHTLNRLSIPLDFKYGCQQPDKLKFLSPEGKKFIKNLQQQGKTTPEIDRQFALKMDNPECFNLLVNNVPPMAERIGRTVTGHRVTASSQEPHVLLMQELTGHDREPMEKALREYEYRLIQFEPHQSESRKKRHHDLLHGTAIFLCDPKNALEVIAKGSLPVSKKDVEENSHLPEDSEEIKNKIANKITGRKVATCVFKLKGTHLAFSAGSEHLVGFDRDAPRGPEMDASRLLGVIQHESHLKQQMAFVQKVEAEHSVKVVAMVSGGDFNEDDRFANRTCEQTSSQVPDDLYRLKISSDSGFLPPQNPRDQEPCKLISEPGKNTQIDFLTLRSDEEIQCKLENNFNGFKDQMDGDPNYPSDHILISADLTIPELAQPSQP